MRTVLLAALLAVLLPSVALAQTSRRTAVPQGPTAATGATGAATTGVTAAPAPAPVAEGPADGNKVEGVGDLNRIPGGHVRTGAQVQAIADVLPNIKAERKKFKGSYPNVYLKGRDRWQVSYFTKTEPPKEIAQVLIQDNTGAVVESYTGYKVAWTMARGYDGAFGKKVNSPWVMIPLTVLFIVPFIQFRRWRRMLHLDILVLAAFGLALHFFTVGKNDQAVPIVATLLFYLVGRMLWIGLRRKPDHPELNRPLPLLVPVTWLAIGAIFLMGFRIGLNVTNSNVIDVGYAGVVGAQKLQDGDRLYGSFPKDIPEGDTYGPVMYAAYVPFEIAFPWSGRWDDLPSAHAAAIAFDLLCVVLIFLVGRMIRGPGLGIVLAYAWLAYPFTIYASNTNANDSLMPAMLLLVLLVSARPAARGATAAVAGMTKLAGLAVAPLMWTYAPDGRPRRVRELSVFVLGFLIAAAVCLLPVFLDGPSLKVVYERTIGYQAGRDAPFSIWGLYDLGTLKVVWQVIAVLLALGLAVVPRRRDVVGLAALVCAVLAAFQLSATYWFYLYLVWLFPFAAIAIFGRYAEPRRA